MEYTKQGVRNLNSIKKAKQIPNCDGLTTCTASKWVTEPIYPSWIGGFREVRYCQCCFRTMATRNERYV
jgi:hypothetical protein